MIKRKINTLIDVAPQKCSNTAPINARQFTKFIYKYLQSHITKMTEQNKFSDNFPKLTERFYGDRRSQDDEDFTGLDLDSYSPDTIYKNDEVHQEMLKVEEMVPEINPRADKGYESKVQFLNNFDGNSSTEHQIISVLDGFQVFEGNIHIIDVEDPFGDKSDQQSSPPPTCHIQKEINPNSLEKELQENDSNIQLLTTANLNSNSTMVQANQDLFGDLYSLMIGQGEDQQVYGYWPFLILSILNLSFQQDSRPSDKTFRNQKRKRKTIQKTPKGQEQRTCHETKYFLTSFKRVVLAYLEKMMGPDYIENNPIVWWIKTKRGIAMQDYVTLFKIKELKQVWEECFRTKYIYREVLLGKANFATQKANIKYAHALERAFKTGEFLYIAGPPAESGSRR